MLDWKFVFASFLRCLPSVNRMTALQIGGMPDHVHLLLALPSTMPLSKALQLIKGGSSKWLHDTFPESSSFGSGLTT
jgi:REP element-mobilizing transposase RayT